jgi:anion-transporting  ArsA/GET3 family ATPase
MGGRLHVVTGKGGVGTSTVAAALTLAARRRGARTLAIELGETGGLSRILGTTPASPGDLAIAEGGARVAYFDGAAALAEYLTRRVHLGRFARALFDHPLYVAFVAAAPGLRELLAMGKVRDELELQRRWDVVVLDAGPSGHALEHLRMPAAAAETFASGRVHAEAAVNAELLRDRARCSIHVVATPEHMAVREAIEDVLALRRLDLATGAALVNRCVPPAPAGVDELIASAPEPIAGELRRARSWETLQEQGIRELEGSLGVRAWRLPRLRVLDGIAQARALAPIVEELL